MNKDYSKYLPYIVTAIVVALVVFVFSMVVELSLLFRCENYVNKRELNMKNLVKFATMEQLEKRLKREPENYIVMLKLAELHEGLGEYDDARSYYQNALLRSQRSQYSLYKYALFCAKMGLYAISASTAEDIISTDKKHIMYKAQVYEALGDKMSSENEVRGAVGAYQVSYKYAKNVKDKKYTDSIANKYSFAYVKLADEYIERDMVPDAITALNNSIKIKETPVALYKLGLIYIDTNKVKAQKYMEKVFNEEPYLVNPYIYNSLLEDLIKVAQDTGNQASLNYYSVKQTRFKGIMNDIYLYKNQIVVYDADIIRDKDKYYLQFSFKNNTKEKIEQLFFYVDIFLNSKHYKVQKKAVYLSKTLPPFEMVENFRIPLPSDMEFVDIEDNNFVVLKFYAKKSTKAPGTLVKINSLNF